MRLEKQPARKRETVWTPFQTYRKPAKPRKLHEGLRQPGHGVCPLPVGIVAYDEVTIWEPASGCQRMATASVTLPRPGQVRFVLEKHRSARQDLIAP